MLDGIAFIGVGHIAKYMIEGLRKVDQSTVLHLFNRSIEKAQNIAAGDANAQVYSSAQDAVEAAQLIIVATRPDDFKSAIEKLAFSSHQVVISVAAGVDLHSIGSLVKPAIAIRAMPISCAAVNKSPTLIYPDHPLASEFFAKIGNVHRLQDEQAFNPATALVGAYYAWLFPMMGHLTDWAIRQGFDEHDARQLVLQINEGACSMAAKQQESFADIWCSLATKGGISDHGMQTLNRLGGIEAWSEALNDVTRKMNNQ